MSRQLPATDVVIVGLGAAGGIAAHVFAEAGLKVVGLEAGPRLGVADYLAEYDELKGYTFENALGRFKANKEVPTWRPNAGSPIAPPLAPIVMANGVGGSSVHYTGQSWRFRQDDFAVRSSTVEKYGESAIPAGAALADWPIVYDDLESFYGNVENLIGVSGTGGANPFESPRTADYPMPPLRRSGLMDLADQAMTTLGYDPFPQPAAVLSESYAGRPACSYCGYCTGYGCWNDSKSSTLVSSIVTAEATGNFEVRPNSRVMKIVSTEAGKVSGVEYLDENGETQVQPAALVVVATYVYENSRLLFLSTSDAYPNGLGNSAGQLGKYYSAHTYISAAGYAPGTNFNALSGTGAQSTAMDNLNGDNFDHTGLGFIRGGIVNVSNGESTPIAASRNVPPSIAPWGSAYKAWLKDGLRSSLSALCQLEVLPYEGNFLDLDQEATDDLGMPRIRITYDIGENERVAGEYIRTRMEEILKEMGATETWSYGAAAMPVNSHAYGGTRMGSDPATSVVNQYGQAHDTANLVVLGGSTFPATTGYNPTETIEAHAWYAADYLAKNIGTIGA